MFYRLMPALALRTALLANACAAAPETNAPADIPAVNELRSSYVAAFNAGDTEALANLYTTGGTSQVNHQPTVTGRDAIMERDRNIFA